MIVRTDESTRFAMAPLEARNKGNGGVSNFYAIRDGGQKFFTPKGRNPLKMLILKK
jgi:hypothetical protein